MDARLEQEVRITNKEGATLEADYLDWTNDKSRVETLSPVRITRQSMQIDAEGLSADTALKNAVFHRQVHVVIPEQEGRQRTTVDCRGPLEIFESSHTAVFNKDVVMDNGEAQLFSDKATVFFDNERKDIVKIVSEGNVRLKKDGNTSSAQRAIYFRDGERVMLEGSPQIIYFTKDEDAGRLP